EAILGRALKGKRDHVVLATKVYGWVDKLPNGHGSSRYHIMREVENSLRRLQTDHIDLYQLHRPHPETPIEETMRAMDDLVRQGKVRYIGTSVFGGWELVEALWTADHYNLERP
ncbi:MAG: aldo/keto reductase, partial [Phycisphaerae bacterium]|nr:aldo/keto reductase [Phycisphaerae bacterium]